MKSVTTSLVIRIIYNELIVQLHATIIEKRERMIHIHN